MVRAGDEIRPARLDERQEVLPRSLYARQPLPLVQQLENALLVAGAQPVDMSQRFIEVERIRQNTTSIPSIAACTSAMLLPPAMAMSECWNRSNSFCSCSST